MVLTANTFALSFNISALRPLLALAVPMVPRHGLAGMLRGVYMLVFIIAGLLGRFRGRPGEGGALLFRLVSIFVFGVPLHLGGGHGPLPLGVPLSGDGGVGTGCDGQRRGHKLRRWSHMVQTTQHHRQSQRRGQGENGPGLGSDPHPEWPATHAWIDWHVRR